MSLPSSINIQTVFNRITGKIVVTDLTNWAAENIDFGVGDTVHIFQSVTYASSLGTVVAYNNIGGATPDISAPNISTVSTADINIPLFGGVPLPTTYTVTLQIKVQPDQGALVTYNKTFTYNYGLTDPTVCLEVSINCGAGILMSTDTTKYGSYTSLSRSHNIFPPPSLGVANVTANLSQILATDIYSPATYEVYLESTVTYTQSDGLIIIVLLKGQQFPPITCDANLNKLVCCLDDLKTEYYDLKKSNPTKAEVLGKQRYFPARDALVEYLAAQQSGNTDIMTEQYDLMVKYSGCNDCKCSTDTPQLVVPITVAGGAYSIDSPDNSIAVVVEVIAGVTVSHIQLSAALQVAIGLLYNTTLTSNDGSVAITPSGNLNYDLSVPVNNNNAVNQLTKQLLLTNTTGNFTLSVSNLINSGTAFANITASITKSATATDIAVITCGNFINLNALSAIVKYNVSANLMRVNTYTGNTNNRNIEVEVYFIDPTVDNGLLYLRLFNPVTGVALSWADLSTMSDDIYIALNFFSEPTQ